MTNIEPLEEERVVSNWNEAGGHSAVEAYDLPYDETPDVILPKWYRTSFFRSVFLVAGICLLLIAIVLVWK